MCFKILSHMTHLTQIDSNDSKRLEWLKMMTFIKKVSYYLKKGQLYLKKWQLNSKKLYFFSKCEIDCRSCGKPSFWVKNVTQMFFLHIHFACITKYSTLNRSSRNCPQYVMIGRLLWQAYTTTKPASACLNLSTYLQQFQFTLYIHKWANSRTAIWKTVIIFL